MATSKRSSLQSPLFKIAIGFLFIALLGLLFLPKIISTTWFTTKAKQAINEKIPGKVQFTDITLSWLEGIQIIDMVFEDQNSGFLFKAEKISTTKGLLSLATNYKDGGVINIQKPQAFIDVQNPREDGKKPNETSLTEKGKKNSNTDRPKEVSQKPQPQKEAGPGLLLPPIRVQLQITDGILATISPEKTRKTILENFNMKLNLDGPKGVVKYTLSFNDKQGSGTVSGEGNVSLPNSEMQGVNALQSDAILEIKNWQIADLLTIAATQLDAPTGTGLINGLLRISGSGETEMSVTGNVTAHEIQLQGGPLQSDTPSINEIAIDLIVQKSLENLKIEKLEIKSPLISGTATGIFGKQQIKTLSVQAKVNSAEIFSQFPTTLNLKQGVRVSEGMIDMTADISTPESTLLFAANANLKRLVGTAGKKKISWDKPVTITVQGTQSPDALILDQLTIDSSFLQADGKGDSDAMQLQLAADIGTALKEFEKFIDLNGWTSGGKLDLGLNITKSSEELRKLQGDITVAHFELNHNGVVISPADTFTAAITSNVQLNSEMIPREFNNVKVEFASWLGRGSIATERYAPSTDGSAAILKNFAAKTLFDLERITTLLHSLEALPREQSLTGPLELSLNITGEDVQEPTILLSANTNPFTFRNGEKSLTEEKVSLDLEATVNLPKESFIIKHLNLYSKPISLEAGGKLLSQNKEQVASATGSTSIDLSLLAEHLKSFAGLQLEMSGISKKPFALEASSAGGVWTDIPKHAQFSTSLNADTIKGYGLNIESLTLPIQLKESLAEIDLKATVNRGEMTAHPRVDFSGTSAVLGLPENSTILKEVGLTGDMSNDLLAKVHPLFKGVAVSKGTINLDMKHLKWPLDKELQKNASFAGAFTFNGVKLQAGTLLSPLLAIMKVEDNEILVSNQPMTFVGENERIICSPLEVTVNEYSLIFVGSIGFDQSLDYTVKIPVTRKMISGDVYKYLEGAFILVPITGTVSKPSISKNFVQKALGDLMVQAGKKQLSEQAGKLLQNLFK
jgi:hypothetical protein